MVMLMICVVRRRAERVLQPESRERSPRELALLSSLDCVRLGMGVKYRLSRDSTLRGSRWDPRDSALSGTAEASDCERVTFLLESRGQDARVGHQEPELAMLAANW